MGARPAPHAVLARSEGRRRRLSRNLWTLRRRQNDGPAVWTVLKARLGAASPSVQRMSGGWSHGAKVDHVDGIERNLSEHSSLRLDLIEAIELGGDNDVPPL